LLSGKYARGKPMPEGTRLSTIEILGPTNWEKVYAIRDALEKIALSRSKTIAQVALNWVLQRPTVSSVIFGARTPAQLHDNLGAIGWNLTAEEIASLVALTDERPPYPLWHQHSFGADRHPLVVER
jgi:aryl-alcohol dehydrogenase-like predicted oxidoreductase